MYYDPEWLEIVKESHRYESTSPNRVILPEKIEIQPSTMIFITELVNKEGGTMDHGFAVPANFVQTAPIYYGSSSDSYDGTVAVRRGNDQTDRFLSLLGMQHTITIPSEAIQRNETNDPNELDLDDDSFIC